MLNVPVRVLLFTLGPTAIGLVAVALLTGWHRRVPRCREDLRDRARTLAPFALVLVGVLLLNAYVRPRVDDISPAFGINLTEHLFTFEGYFVPWLQDVTPEPLVLYLAAVYVVGYAVLLLFPPVAYAVLDDLEHAATLFTAYAVNYLVGAVVYVLVVAVGPRNWFGWWEISQPLYHQFPDVMFLTDAVNSETNVFPSLHASMAVTVLLLAYFSRAEYPRWFVVAGVLAPSVLLATMVLGIHWLADVIAGVGLAVVSVLLARWIVPRVRGWRRQSRERRAVDGVQL